MRRLRRRTKMCRCCDCRAVFEQPAVLRETRPYGAYGAYEEFSVCPKCGSEQLELVVKTKSGWQTVVFF